MDYGFSFSIDTAAYLIVNSQIFPLKNEVTTIGRTFDNDLIIQEVSVSRHHAEIIKIGENFHIRDLQSTAGTYINKFKVKECALYSGDLILVANIPIMFINQGYKVNDDSHNATSSLFGMQDW